MKSYIEFIWDEKFSDHITPHEQNKIICPEMFSH